jgi:hypothetical protein
MSVWGGLTSKVTIIPSIIPLLSTALLSMPENSLFILGKPFQEIDRVASKSVSQSSVKVIFQLINVLIIV